MADTYTQALKARKIESGGYDPDWSARLNADVVDIFDAGISGQIEIDIGSSTTYALAAMVNGTLSDSHYWRLNFVGTPASAVTVTVHASVTPSKAYLIDNQTGQTLTIKYAATAGVDIVDGDAVNVYCDGTTVVEDSRTPRHKRTPAEIAAGVTPTNYAYPFLHVERYSSLQVALNMLLAAGGTLTCEKGKTYSLTSAITLLRSSVSHATEMIIDGQGATLDFSGGTFTSDYLADQQTNLFSVGSVVNTAAPASPQYIIELGLIAIRDLTIVGPEATPPFNAPNPGVDVPVTGTVGLRLQLAHNVTLDNVKITNCVVGMETKDSWDIVVNHVLVRNSWIGYSIHGGSTTTTWIECGAVQCCYSVIMRSWEKAAAPTYGAYAAISDQAFLNLRVENCWYGPILYPVDTAIRGCYFGGGGYAEDVSRDFFVSGFAWDQTQADDPASHLSVAVANTVDRLCVHYASRGATTTSPFEIFRAPTGGSTNNVHCHLTLPRLAADLSAGFKSSYVMLLGNDTEGAGSIYMYDASGSLAYKQSMGGNIMLGAGKNTAETISETGLELRTDGSVWATAEGNVVGHFNRKTSTGGLMTFSQAGNTVGGIDVLADMTVLRLTDADVKIIPNAGTPEGSVTAGVGACCLDITNGVMYMKKTGTGNSGWKLVTQAA